ncbi:hypothetical protein K3G63_11265 [Hymenobacter sp. HSC-4F20]|uniref:hypothetical protein n=1 Tax=Hymenobacter sp. HSC-4F20 TaxID=2864135 RepID=UPI001C738228|nr:hypothetical protein [Hymenobacter sp. HSC-4F20]MBX0291023.1 hypothetical protein [Hymenobacter sp. HSC-4F20]
MRKLGLIAAVLLLSSTSAWAQGDKKTKAATTTPTHLPGEEKLSAQERAERDFLMPIRRKQAATLRAAAEETAVNQPAVEVTARNLEATEEDKPAEATEAKAAPAAVHHTSSARHSSSSHRRASSHRTGSSARRKTTAKKSATKKKVTSRRRR